MKVKCLIHSTAGKQGEIKEFPNNRAMQLIKSKICEEVKAEVKPKQKKNK